LLKICNENDMPVCLLNIKAVLTIDDSSNATVSEAYSGSLIDAGYYESVVAIIPSEKLDSLTTAFWKHG
jgi:LEA14-like dessication related protein